MKAMRLVGRPRLGRGRGNDGAGGTDATNRTKWVFVVAAGVCAALAGLPGCELLVDFDRSKIPQEEAGSSDATTAPEGSSGEDGSSAAESAAADASPPPSEAGADGPVESSAVDAPAADGPVSDSPSTDGPADSSSDTAA